jgi:vitamin B12 transporter
LIFYGNRYKFKLLHMIACSKRLTKKENFSFRTWARKNYSLFAVLKKVVKISVLPVTYLLSLPVVSVAQNSDSTLIRLNLDEIEISAQELPEVFPENARVLSVVERAEIERLPAESLQDILEYIAAIDVRQRGAEGVQADISIRGGTFDQTLILLNGINITNPQTGHHNLDLPVSLSQIEKIEVLEGPAARIYGPNAFSGAINIVTRKPAGRSISGKLDAGSHRYFNYGISGNFSAGNTSHLLSGNRTSSGGYIPNTDFNISTVFYSGLLNAKTGRLSLQAGASGKGFGANSFYTPKYPNQYEETKTLFASAAWKSSSKFHFTPSLYGRRHYDTFMLFRENAPEWYKNHNHHRTDIWGITAGSWFLWAGGKTSLGAAFRWEGILSNVLGEKRDVPVRGPSEEIQYTHSDSRSVSSVYLDHVFYLNRWMINAGAMGNHIGGNRPDWNIFPGIDLSYRMAQPLKMVVSWNSSLRMPTFTDLYYSGPANTGNPDLEPERSETLEGGLKLKTKSLQGHLIVFSRVGKNSIDWVRAPGDELWKSVNHTRIHSRGAELMLQVSQTTDDSGGWPASLQLGYLYNTLNKKETDLISYYVLDNLRHKLTASINRTFAKTFSAGVVIIYQDRNGSYTSFKNGASQGEVPYDPFWLLDAKVSYRYRNMQFFISAKNLWNQEYMDLGNVSQPGRWIKAGASVTIPGKSAGK